MDARLIVALGLAVSIASLTGCYAALKASPERSIDKTKEIEALKAYLGPEVVTKYSAPDAARRQGLTRRAWRDEVIHARLRVMDLHFNSFQQALFQEGVGLGIATDWATLALGSLGAVYENASQVLSLASTGITGAKAAFDRHAFFEKTMPTIVSTMIANRREVLVRIRTGLTKEVSEYPLSLALADLEAYYIAGTIPGALIEINETSGQVAKRADAALEEILVVSVVPEALQNRREAMSAWAKTLAYPDLKKLGGILSVPSDVVDEIDLLTHVLRKVSAADTPEAFDAIAMQVKEQFGEDF